LKKKRKKKRKRKKKSGKNPLNVVYPLFFFLP